MVLQRSAVTFRFEMRSTFIMQLGRRKKTLSFGITTANMEQIFQLRYSKCIKNTSKGFQEQLRGSKREWGYVCPYISTLNPPFSNFYVPAYIFSNSEKCLYSKCFRFYTNKCLISLTNANYCLFLCLSVSIILKPLCAVDAFFFLTLLFSQSHSKVHSSVWGIIDPIISFNFVIQYVNVTRDSSQ